MSRGFFESRAALVRTPHFVDYVDDGASLPVNIYSCLFAVDLNFARGDAFQAYFSHLDARADDGTSGWSEHCWSDQVVLAFAVAHFLTPPEVEELWVFGKHQKATKAPGDGWNGSGRGLPPS